MIQIINLCEDLKNLRLNEIKSYNLTLNTKKNHLENTRKIENENTNKVALILKFFSDVGYERDLFKEIYDHIKKEINIEIKNNSYAVYCEILKYLSKNYKKETRQYLKSLKKTSNT